MRRKAIELERHKTKGLWKENKVKMKALISEQMYCLQSFNRSSEERDKKERERDNT